MKEFVPSGHFFSPIVNIDDVKKEEARIWPDNPHVIGVDFNDLSHEKILTRQFPKYICEYDYPSESCRKPFDFYNNNPNFSGLDSRTLFIMLRMLNPANMIEIGSGYSSLLTADVNRRFLNNRLNLTCIDSYPEPFLLSGIPGISDLIKSKVEHLPLSVFSDLKSGDFLFIDSSHVSKTGSDVNHIYFEIIPRLNPGIFIHIHDIFLPFDYKKEWVINEGRCWNEQYLVRSLLMYSSAFEVIFGCNYAAYRHSHLVKDALRGEFYGGGSLWIRFLGS